MSRFALTLLGVLLLSIVASAPADTLYWDPTGTASISGGGSGTWTSSAGTWYSITGGSDTQWTDTIGADTAVFGGTGDVVSVSGGVTANALTFNAAGYLLSGGTITLAG
jgi:fibronectin-binding autotransporter adhesin